MKFKLRLFWCVVLYIKIKEKIMSTSVLETPEAVKKEKKELERELIKSLAGCYRVSFKFSETFSPIKNYEYHDRKFSAAKEVAHIIEETEDKISIQHILFVNNDVIIKHWRQDWIYENRELVVLEKNHEWKKIILTPEQAAGTWSQKVYQVDDAPRYEGFGTWVHVDGRHFWESTANAALPRREISTAGRTDYNVLKRHSHIEIFDNGDWVLEQDNKKIHCNDNGEETLICMEKGLETFTKKDYDPQLAIDMWENQVDFWALVRQIWKDITDSRDKIVINKDEDLYMAQLGLSKTFSGENFNEEKATSEIKALLSKHVEGYNG